MRLTITQRFFLALLVMSLVSIALNVLVNRWSFQREFLAYKAEQEAVLLSTVAEGMADYYAVHQSWELLSNNPRRWQGLLRQSSPAGIAAAPNSDQLQTPSRLQAGPHTRPPPRPTPDSRREGPPPRHPPPHEAPPRDPLGIAERMALFDANGQQVAGSEIDLPSSQALAIDVNGEQVGTLYLALPRNLTESIDVQFDLGQSRSLIVTAVAIGLLAAFAAFLLARQMTQPVRLIAERTRAIAGGNFEDRLVVDTNNELGDLANDINQLTATLAHDQQLRREWLSDVSHELRTPLAILTGELQAIEDGIRTFSPDTLASLQAEVARINRLVADLSTLSASEEGQLAMHFAKIDIGEVLEQCVASTRQRLDGQDIELNYHPASAPCLVKADALRITQVITNLIENSIKYTNAPGCIDIHVNDAAPDTVQIIIEDSAPGVPEPMLDRLFDRLFRVEQSRGRKGGGSGLGLSISKALVVAHEGEITASASSLGGLRLVIRLPRMPNGSHA